MSNLKKSFLMGTVAAGAALCTSAFFSILAVQAACQNPLTIPTGFTAPCPVFSLSASSVSQSQSLTISALPQPGTDYIYTTAYVSNGTAWNPYTLQGNNAYPSYSSALASLTLSSTQLQSLSLGTHYSVVWDWLWDATANCYKGPGLNQCNTGAWRVQSLSLTSAATPTPSPTPNPSCLSSTTGWQAQSFSTQTGSFTATFDATPNANLMDGVTGLSQVQAAAYTDLAVIVRFNTAGIIDAINGSAYSASTLAYAAGSTYHIRLVVSVPTHTYSVYVTPPGQ